MAKGARLTPADVALRWFLDERGREEVARLLNVSNRDLSRWLSSGVPKKHGERVRNAWRTAHVSDEIETLLADAAECVANKFGHRPHQHFVRNRDGTIDAQLTVYDYPRGLSPRYALLDTGECASALRNLSDEPFLQIGVRWGNVERDETSKRPKDTGDRRYRGLHEGSTYWYRAHRWGDMIAYAAAMADRVSAKRHNKKIETIFIRVHWNKEGRQPAR